MVLNLSKALILLLLVELGVFPSIHKTEGFTSSHRSNRHDLSNAVLSVSSSSSSVPSATRNFELEFIRKLKQASTIQEMKTLIQLTNRIRIFPSSLSSTTAITTDTDPDGDLTDSITPNMAAAALRSILVQSQPKKMQNNCDNNDKLVHEIKQQLLPQLMRTAAKGVFARRRSHQQQPSNADTLVLTRLSLQDLLFSLTLVKNREKMVPFADVICDCMTLNLVDTLHLEPLRLLEILSSLDQLNLNHPNLVDAICDRLCYGDALGNLQPHHLCWALQTLHKPHYANTYPETVRAIMRRFNKQNVRRALNTKNVAAILRMVSRFSRNKELAEDAERLVYNLIARELTRRQDEEQHDDGSEAKALASELEFEEALVVMQTAAKFHLKAENLPVLGDVLQALHSNLPGQLSVKQISQILMAIDRTGVVVKDDRLLQGLGEQFLDCVKSCRPVDRQSLNTILFRVARLSSDRIVGGAYIEAVEQILSRSRHQMGLVDNFGMYDIANLLYFLYHIRHPSAKIGKQLGQQLETFVNNKPPSQSVSPEDVVKTFRYSQLLYKGQQQVLDRFLGIISTLILEGSGDENVLSSCSSEHVCHMMESLSLSTQDDAHVLSALCDRALELNINDDCDPATAKRLLNAVATFSRTKGDDATIRGLQSEMFEKFGPSLLSHQLDSSGAAAAMLAYARATYVADMGIFDHLANSVSTSLDRLSTREISGCLWACGKIYTWEIQNSGTVPFIENARTYVNHLSGRTDELCPKDLAQTLWACGKLRFTDLGVIGPLAHRIEDILQDCLASHVSNIIWGLSKVGFDEKEMIYKFVDRMSDPSAKATPKDAACVLYSLANLNYRDSEIFGRLNDIMINNLDEVNAQALANALWAHSTVGLTPSESLLQTWVANNLGLNMTIISRGVDAALEPK